MTTTVVLKGAANDKDALRMAVRFAAKDQSLLRVVLGRECDADELEVHLYACLAELRKEGARRPPSFVIERSYGARQKSSIPPQHEVRRWG
ncbi:MAG: hypothetical protein JOZ39_03555 [Chloroflexi bacterium]|nr:hypothetical protein [Chloroflexota bacterium]